ncbi:MAG: glycosyltransferase, partial [Gemmatimonadaceae bacterium]
MRILFSPCAGRGARSHVVALLALARRLDATAHDAAFLLPSTLHRLFKPICNVLDIHYVEDTALRNEMAAIKRFRADVVVDDLSMTAIMSTKLSRKPRIAVQRTGVFAGATPRNPRHRHSCQTYFDDLYKGFELVLGNDTPATMADACAADLKIIPGIPSVEVLPRALVGDPTYVFAGALVVGDEVYAHADMRARGVSIDSVDRFLDAHLDRPLVYVTMGHIANGGTVLRRMIADMIDTGAAVISNVDVPELTASQREVFYFAPVLPMHTICSRVTLMVQHCGSGTYQYSILHAVPSICIGTGCYDRDDVAARLHELGAAEYIAAPAEHDDFAAAFRS